MADDLKQFIKKQGVETRRHFDVVAEDIRSSMTQIAEGVSTNSELLERLDKRVFLLEKKLQGA